MCTFGKAIFGAFVVVVVGVGVVRIRQILADEAGEAW